MSAWPRSGAAVRLLAVLCMTAGCAAAQQQRQQQQLQLRNEDSQQLHQQQQQQRKQQQQQLPTEQQQQQQQQLPKEDGQHLHQQQQQQEKQQQQKRRQQLSGEQQQLAKGEDHQRQQQQPQRQQQPSSAFSATPDQLQRLIEQLVHTELQPLVSRLESRVDALDNRLVTLDSRMDAMDSRLESELDAPDSGLQSKVEALDGKLESRMVAFDSRLIQLDSRVDEITIHLLKTSRNPQLSNILENHKSPLEELETALDIQKSKVEGISTEMGDQKSRLDDLTTRLDSRESQVIELATKLGSQQLQLVTLINATKTERLRLDEATNKTASQQTQIDGLTVRLDLLDDRRKPRDCSELPAWATTGVYFIWPRPDRSESPVQAFCEMETDSGHWTVLQRRDDIQPRQNFLFGWTAYKHGFGELSGEFWWGLEHMAQMTSVHDRRFELRVDLEDFNGNTSHAVYQDFRISSEEEGYRLSVSNYSGNAGDSLSYHVDTDFSTHDITPDGRSGASCAENRDVAWWYRWYCGLSSLNGRYMDSDASEWAGIWWWTWKELESLKRTEMKIRPI